MQYESLIGKPFEWGGRGNPGFDCWGLVRECYRMADVQTPEYDTPEGMASRISAILLGVMEWEVAERGVGAMVLFSLPGGMKHVGYCIDGNRFIHCWEGSGGVCIERISTWQRRIQGFYKPAGAVK
jgi:cell wall-associated NlpC family hydrolase